MDFHERIKKLRNKIVNGGLIMTDLRLKKLHKCLCLDKLCCLGKLSVCKCNQLSEIKSQL